jgi:hypothetical protein
MVTPAVLLPESYPVNSLNIGVYAEKVCAGASEEVMENSDDDLELVVQMTFLTSANLFGRTPRRPFREL